jgi:hypothetical protein
MREPTQGALSLDDEGAKVCSKCSKAWPADHFKTHSRICKACRRVYAREYSRQVRAEATRVDFAPRQCKLCSTSFVPKHWKTQFCSDPCRQTWYGNRCNDQKRCRTCRQTKDLSTEFDRLSSSCRECVALFAEQRRRCNRCTEIKPWSEFPPRDGSPEEPASACWECARIRGREYHARHQVKGQRRERRFRERYGITVAEYEQMLADQGGFCAICHEPSSKSLHVDHDHATGVVRALLCFGCNALLGHCQDDIVRLRSAIKYLERYEQ